MDLTIGAVVPCHNYGRFLGECLESLLRQTRPLQQIVVVLDGCTDDSAEVAAAYRWRGVEVVVANVRSIYLARRLGLQELDTDVVFCLDADDRVTADYAERALEIFRRRPEVGVVTPICRSFGEQFGEWRPDPEGSIEEQNRATSGSAMRREAIEQAGAFDQLAGVRRQDEDWFVWRHLVRAGWKIARSDAIHQHRRHHQNYSLAYEHPWAVTVRRNQNYLPPRKLRVGWVTPTLCTGGVTTNTLTKLRWARTVEWTAAVLLDGAPSDELARLAFEAQGVPLIGGVPNDFANATIQDRRPSARDAALEVARRSDVIYTWGHLDAGLVEAISRICPVVFGLHGEAEWTVRAAAGSAMHVSRFYAVSRAAARCAPEVARDRTVVIENGIDLELLAPRAGRRATRELWGLAEHERAVGFIGRVSPEKRPEAVVDALRGLPESFRPVYITPQADPAAVVWHHQTRDLIQAKVAARRGIWLSAPPDGLGDVFSALDCLVIPSRDEGGPLVLLEGFAAGVPVACTPVGLVPSMERRHGPLVTGINQPASRTIVQHAICDVLDGEHEVRTARAREAVWRHHTASRMAAEFEALCWSAAR